MRKAKVNVIKVTIAFVCLTLSAQSSFGSSLSLLLTEEKLATYSPQARVALSSTLIRNLPLLEQAGIDSELRLRHFIAQTATETGGFRRLDENLRYSASRLLVVFKNRVTPEQAKILEYKPVPTANHVYCDRLGNGGEASNDGWLFRGSGFIQLTGRENYRLRGEQTGLALEKDPDLVRTPDAGLRAAVAFWVAQKVNDAADRDDINDVRKRVNGGLNGLAASKLWYLRAKHMLVAGSPQFDLDQDEETAALTAALQDIGFMPPAGAAADLIPLDQAIKAFQHDRGIEESGYLDDTTFYAITDPDDRYLD